MPASSSAEPDHALLARVREGDHAAFARLVDIHARRFYALAYRYLQNREAAEDVVQEAFLRLWERPDRWDAARETRFTTWFYRVVANLCLDALKKKRPLPLGEIDLPDPQTGQEEKLGERQVQMALERAIAALPQSQRLAVNLCYQEGLSNQEAAEAMKLSLKALQSLLSRARAALKEKMKRYGENP